MICNGDNLHDWTIARRNLIYCLTEIVCANCGLVYNSLLAYNEHNGHFKEKEPETPGYRARQIRTSLERRYNKMMTRSEMTKVELMKGE